MDNVFSVTIYDSWVKVADTLKDAQKGQFYTAIAHYALYGEEPKLKSPLDAYFALIRASIDTSNARKQAGSNGGKKSKANGKQNGKQNASKTQAKTEANGKQNASIENENENENENTLSACAPSCACEAEAIARKYPRAKVGDFRKVVEAVIRASGREMEYHSDLSVTDAVAVVDAGTVNYALAVRNWKEKRYISDAVKFYDSGMYNHDPETWKESDGKSDDDPWGLNNGGDR